MSAPEKKCRHKERRRKHINSCVSQCLDCGMLYAMIAGKTSISRKWVKPDDPRVELGKAATERVIAREHALAEERALLRTRILGASPPRVHNKDDRQPGCHMCNNPEHPEACPRHCSCSSCVKKREAFERGYQAGLRYAQELVHENADVCDFSILVFDQGLARELALAPK